LYVLIISDKDYAGHFVSYVYRKDIQIASNDKLVQVDLAFSVTSLFIEAGTF